jgi:solute carrier family 25 2-oxodicarboxylate transporter 21
VGNSEYKSIGDCFSKIIKTEGPKALYRGILPPILVEAPKRAIKFAANEKYKHAYMHAFGLSESKALSVLTGMSAGVTEAVIVATPDLIKIRMQDKRNVRAFLGWRGRVVGVLPAGWAGPGPRRARTRSHTTHSTHTPDTP